jgi:hypothetical protein
MYFKGPLGFRSSQVWPKQGWVWQLEHQLDGGAEFA